ncbi:hypothetical protein QF035_010243 [Streptomyces umbrinus]|uniref:Uncharacterized protein n=1 Tax=Streptomyces umbrinus TaxID=67370 RepID=A0ABU0TA21_9ACTN|nr:hypothetical protein [Streptomyces umbrinus]
MMLEPAVGFEATAYAAVRTQEIREMRTTARFPSA